MATVLAYIGGAGVGKTTTLMNTMTELTKKLYPDPRLIGFISFTKAARQEAAARAADRFNLRTSELEQDGWFRTVHSAAYKLLGVGDRLLSPGRESQKWVQDAIGAEVSGVGDPNPENEYGNRDERSTEADAALALWSLARSSMVPLKDVHARAWSLDPRLPGLPECVRLIKRYEQAKRLDNRVDFTDLLSQYAGVAFSPDGGPADVPAYGEIPNVPVWFLDEAQDNSPLIDRAARRLTSKAELIYLSGDPFQSVYEWSGSDHRLFRQWDADRQRVLDQSYRCPDKILALGESCLKSCSDYWDRKIRPRPPKEETANARARREKFDLDEINFVYRHAEWSQLLDPRESWLLLARTNFQARRLMAICKNAGVPWRPIKGNGGWAAPTRAEVSRILMGLEEDTPIEAAQWAEVVKHIPSKAEGEELLVRGTKAEWEKGLHDQDDRTLLREQLTEWGATERLITLICAGRWTKWIENGDEFRTAVRRYGYDAAMCREDTKAGIRVGTVHAAKGMEGDNVVVLTTSSGPVFRSAQLDQRGADEEARVAYVACTRARDQLFIMDERAKHRMPIPGP